MKKSIRKIFLYQCKTMESINYFELYSMVFDNVKCKQRVESRSKRESQVRMSAKQMIRFYDVSPLFFLYFL